MLGLQRHLFRKQCMERYCCWNLAGVRQWLWGPGPGFSASSSERRASLSALVTRFSQRSVEAQQGLVCGLVPLSTGKGMVLARETVSSCQPLLHLSSQPTAPAFMLHPSGQPWTASFAPSFPAKRKQHSLGLPALRYWNTTKPNEWRQGHGEGRSFICYKLGSWSAWLYLVSSFHLSTGKKWLTSQQMWPFCTEFSVWAKLCIILCKVFVNSLHFPGT